MDVPAAEMAQAAPPSETADTALALDGDQPMEFGLPAGKAMPDLSGLMVYLAWQNPKLPPLPVEADLLDELIRQRRILFQVSSTSSSRRSTDAS